MRKVVEYSVAALIALVVVASVAPELGRVMAGMQAASAALSGEATPITTH